MTQALQNPPILDLEPDEGDLLAEVVDGLSKPVGARTLPCKFFYDEQGSRLFDRITELPEYYQTRTEMAILQGCAGELADRLGGGVTLVEYGSGSSYKTRVLLDALDLARYVPIDISRWYVLTSARQLAKEYPGLDIRPVCADYAQTIRLPHDGDDDANRVAFFPGSTIGNFTPTAAKAFLRRVAATLGNGAGAGTGGGRLLVGVDLKKDPARLHAAYNDAAGVTARFNLNLLARLNRELDADFALPSWHHHAPYNPRDGRVEMFLVSADDQTVHLGGRAFDFERGEAIHTENSCKYTVAGFERLAAEAGFGREAAWTDDEELFAVLLLRAGA